MGKGFHIAVREELEKFRICSLNVCGPFPQKEYLGFPKLGVLFWRSQ